MKLFQLTALAAALVSTATAQAPPPVHSRSRLPGRYMVSADNYAEHFFTQILDHKNTSAGTFQQRYYVSDEYWAGPGSPVIVFTPGEIDASGYVGYLTNATLNGLIAQEIGAATIVLEHRFWGASSPYSDLTTANLTQLNLYNNIQDLVNFAQTVELPFAKSANSNAADVPWVLIGGSYSGALAAWTESVAPGTFWASLATSAPVEAISNYWRYFEPIQLGMPQNCSKDVTRVIDYLDGVFINGTVIEQNLIKAQFGLEGVAHGDDFMSALLSGPYLWQENGFSYNEGFFEFCDYVEGVAGLSDPFLPGPDGVGLARALQGYAAYMRSIVPGSCESYGYSQFSGEYNVACYDTYNASSPIYTDTSVGNPVDRQWIWLLCSQPFGYWQDGAPKDVPTIASRLVDVEYQVRQCAEYFPPGPEGQTYGIAAGRSEAEVNSWTGGWFIDNTTRLLYVNGQFDPWRESSVSANQRPGGPLQSTEQVPVLVVPGGYHCTDLLTSNGEANAGCAKVQEQEILQIASWVKEFEKK